MSETFSSSSLKNLFKFPFQSPNWPNRFLIGSGLLAAAFILPLLPLIFVYGYVIRVMRQAIQGEPLALPEWNDWGQLAKDGLRCFVAGICFLAPGVIVIITGWVLYMVVFIGGTAILSGSNSSDVAAGIPVIMIFGSLGILFTSIFLGSLLTLLGVVPFPVALGHVVAKDRMGAILHVREWLAIIKADRWGYLISWVLTVGIGGIMYYGFMAVYFIGIFCFPILLIGVPIGLYFMIVAAEIFGQFYRQGAGQVARSPGQDTGPLATAAD